MVCDVCLHAKIYLYLIWIYLYFDLMNNWSHQKSAAISRLVSVRLNSDTLRYYAKVSLEFYLEVFEK